MLVVVAFLGNSAFGMWGHTYSKDTLENRFGYRPPVHNPVFVKSQPCLGPQQRAAYKTEVIQELTEDPAIPATIRQNIIDLNTSANENIAQKQEESKAHSYGIFAKDSKEASQFLANHYANFLHAFNADTSFVTDDSFALHQPWAPIHQELFSFVEIRTSAAEGTSNSLKVKELREIIKKIFGASYYAHRAFENKQQWKDDTYNNRAIEFM